jgi:hypothetical protein
MAMDIDSIWGGDEAEYFLCEDWTGQITLSAFKKSVFGRKAFRQEFLRRKADPFTHPARRANQSMTAMHLATAS